MKSQAQSPQTGKAEKTVQAPQLPGMGRGNAAMQDKMLAKAGRANDPAERQADAVADRVARAATAKGKAVGRKHAESGSGSGDTASKGQQNSIIPQALVDAFSSVMGVDVSGIEVVIGGGDSTLQALGANAMAQNRTVHLPTGFSADNAEGIHRLAHELAHVVLGHAEAGGPIRRNLSAPDHTLKRGDRGAGVEALQRALVHLGFMSSAQMSTGPGIFGSRTESAVTGFQIDHHIDAIGVYGPQTHAALTRELGGQAASNDSSQSSGSSRVSAAAPAPSLSYGSHGTKVEQLQRAMVQLGYMTSTQLATGPGNFGPITKGAVIAFQRAWGITANGVYGSATQAALTRALSGEHPPAHTNSGSSDSSSSDSSAGSGSATTADAFRERIMSAARSHLGARYYWGADGPSMFDCSGFVLYVLRQDTGLINWGDDTAAGISGRLPTTRSPKKGDPVFYRGSSGISHITLYTGSGTNTIGAGGGGSHTFGQDPNACVKYTDYTDDSRTKSFGSIENLIQSKLRR